MKKETKKTASKSAVKKRITVKKAPKTVKKTSTPKKSVSAPKKTPVKQKRTAVKPVLPQPNPSEKPQTQLSHRRPLLIIPK